MIVRRLNAHPFRTQPQPAADSIDMRVDRERRHSNTESHHDRRRLKPDAVKPRQPIPSLDRLHLPKKRQVQRPALRGNRLQDRLNPGAFLIREARRPDARDNRVRVRVANRFKRGEPSGQVCERDIAVPVVDYPK